MKNALLIVSLTCFCLGANGQEKQQAPKTNKTTEQKATGSESQPFFIKQHKTPNEKAEDEQVAKDVKENLQVQRDTLKVNEKMLKANQISAHYTKRGAWVAFFASIAAILALLIAGIQAVFFWRQLERMQESNDTAATAANAALLQSQSIRLAERAYLKMSAHKDSVKIRTGKGLKFGLRVKNYGNTTAVVTQEKNVTLIVNHANDLPERPPYGAIDNGDAAERSADVLVRSESHISDRIFALSNAQIEQIRSGNKVLFVAGFTDYMDVFGGRHRAGYLWIYVYQTSEGDDPEGDDPDASPLEMLPAYSVRNYQYDIERTPDMENRGNDWDEKSITAYRAQVDAKPKSWRWQWPLRSLRAYK